MARRHPSLRAFVPAALCVALAMFVIAAFTGQWPWAENGYNSYTLQACAWLQGRLDLGQDYPWLELAIKDGRYYVSFPPFPSVVLLPFAAMFGTATPDGWIALFTAMLGVWHACALCVTLKQNTRATLFWVLALFLCNGWLWIAVNGYVWFIAQNMCFTLCLASLHHAARGRGGFSLAAWACAVGCRPTVVLFLPVLLIMLYEHEKNDAPNVPLVRLIGRRWYWALPTALIAAGYMWLNHARFGSIVEFGHNYLPEFTREVNGQFHLSYLLPNLQSLFAFPALPQDGEGALTWSGINGGCFYLVNPLIIISFIACGLAWAAGRGSRAMRIVLPVCAVCYGLLICCHRTLGGWHFGNRYLLETLPFLLYGLLQWKPKSAAFARWTLPYLMMGGMINLIGTAALYAGWI